jgi:hypothetical protein
MSKKRTLSMMRYIVHELVFGRHLLPWTILVVVGVGVLIPFQMLHGIESEKVKQTGLQGRISDLESKISTLQKSNDSLKDHLTTVQKELADKVSQGAFNSAIADKATKAELSSELSDKISTGKLYRIKSAKAPVYVGINSQAVYGGGLSLGDQQHNYNEPGLQWSFVENW